MKKDEIWSVQNHFGFIIADAALIEKFSLQVEMAWTIKKIQEILSAFKENRKIVIFERN